MRGAHRADVDKREYPYTPMVFRWKGMTWTAPAPCRRKNCRRIWMCSEASLCAIGARLYPAAPGRVCLGVDSQEVFFGGDDDGVDREELIRQNGRVTTSTERLVV